MLPSVTQLFNNVAVVTAVIIVTDVMLVIPLIFITQLSPLSHYIVITATTIMNLLSQTHSWGLFTYHLNKFLGKSKNLKIDFVLLVARLLVIIG